VVEAVARRLARLSGAAQQLAAVASTLDEPFGRHHLLRAGGLPAAAFDAALDELVDLQREALWLLTISLRNQGRLREALATAASLEEVTRRHAADHATISGMQRAQVLLPAGRAR
jgi:hypothetical protein